MNRADRRESYSTLILWRTPVINIRMSINFPILYVKEVGNVTISASKFTHTTEIYFFRCYFPVFSCVLLLFRTQRRKVCRGSRKLRYYFFSIYKCTLKHLYTFVANRTVVNCLSTQILMITSIDLISEYMNNIKY